MEEKITELQTIVGHQEVEIANLSAELYVQQKELSKLKQQMANLIERFLSLSEATEAARDKSPEPPPPHY